MPSAGRGDQSSVRRGRRRTDQLIEVNVEGVKVSYDSFPVGQHYSSTTSISLREMSIEDYIKTSRWKKLMCYQAVPHQPRESNAPMFRATIDCVRPDPNVNDPSTEELRLKVALLSLRFNVDQDALDFLRFFFTFTFKSAEDGLAGSTGSGSRSSPLSASGGRMSVGPSVASDQEDLEPPQAFFQMCEAHGFPVRIDYKPKRMDYARLRNGSYVELLNLFPLEGVELNLKRVRLTGVRGWGAVVENMIASWVLDITQTQLHRCVSGVQPIRSLVNIASGAADLVLVPLEHHQNHKGVLRGIRKGASSFLRSVTNVTIDIGTSMAVGTQGLLEQAVSSSGDTAVHGSGSRKANQPRNASDGLHQAYESLSRGFKGARNTLVCIPRDDIQRHGSSSMGYVKSVAKAVPVAVLRPMIGVTEALSKAMMGVRNTVDPSKQVEATYKYKTPHH